MGYRSEVVIILYRKDYEELASAAKKEIPYFGKYEGFMDILPKHFKYGIEEYTYLRWNAVKWYDGFDEIQLINSFLMKHDHNFVRIGEDPTDIVWDVKGEDFYEFLSIRSTIEFYPEVCNAILEGMKTPEEEL